MNAPGRSPARIPEGAAHWAAIRADHSARHGRTWPEFSRELGLWWGGLPSAWRVHCAPGERPAN